MGNSYVCNRSNLTIFAQHRKGGAGRTNFAKYWRSDSRKKGPQAARSRSVKLVAEWAFGFESVAGVAHPLAEQFALQFQFRPMLWPPRQVPGLARVTVEIE
jgi:hypothetical protein